jgi:NAD(P)-dependent dehydrogenase (short-subunit alcohol dehydrogenase family)
VTGRDESALADSAAEVSRLGGEGIGVVCDHCSDAATRALFQRVQAEQGGLDVLVNSAWGGYENMVDAGEFTWERPFWQQRSGLIVHISTWAAQKYIANVAYGVAKTATDRMAADMAHELREHGVAVLSLYPGLVRTEKVMESADFLDLSNSESPRFTGRAVSALAHDPDVLKRSGQTLVAATLAREYDFTDLDGSQPLPLTLGDA